MAKPILVDNQKKHYYYMDILNIMATMAVLWLHTSEYAFEYKPYDPSWYISLIIQVVFIWAVPIFFMISGANLLNYRDRYDTKTFFKKRMLRVLLPFIFWSFIWYAWNHFVMHQDNWSIKGFINGIEYDTIQPIFWFFYFVIPIYIAMPFLSVLATKANKKVVTYIITLYVIGVGIINYGYMLLQRTPDQMVNNVPLVLSTGVGIFFIGWYLHTFEITKKVRYWLYAGTGLSIIFMILTTIMLSAIRGETVRDVYSVFSIGGFFIPLGIWAWAQHRFDITWQPSAKVATWLRKLSGVSLGVYVIHEFLIMIIEHVFSLSASSWVHLFILPLIVWLLSVIMILILQRIPVVKRLLP